MLTIFAPIPRVRYLLSFTPEVIMPITRILRHDNVQAIRIPAELAYPESVSEFEIERIDDELHIRPVRTEQRSLVEALEILRQLGPEVASKVRDWDEEDDEETP
jgi:antitoxin VapB